MKIQTKYFFVTISVILITGTAAIIGIGSISRNIIEKEIKQRLEAASCQMAQHVQTVLDEYKRHVKCMTTGCAYTDVVDRSKDFNQSLERFKIRVKKLLQVQEAVSGVRISDKTGTVIAATYMDTGNDIANNELFLKGRNGIYIGDMHISGLSKNPVVSMAGPIFINNEPMGVIIVDFEAGEKIFKILTDRTDLGETAEAYIINKHGFMITPSRFIEDAVLKQRVNTSHTDESVLTTNYLGVKVLRTYKHLSGMNWCLLAEISKKEAFAPVFGFTHLLLLLHAILCAVGTVLSIVISKTVTNPIVKLHHGTEQIMNGNLDYKVGTEFKDEIGQLSRAFDSMTGNLKKSRERLTELVKQRTMQLDKKINESNQQKNAIMNIARDMEELNADLKEQIRDRKKAETALSESEDQYQILIHSMEALIFSVDREGCFHTAGGLRLKSLNLSPEDIIGKTIFDLFPREEAERYQELHQQVFETGKTLVYEHENDYGGKKSIDLTTIYPVHNTNGDINLVCVVCRDVTEQRLLEEQLRVSQRMEVVGQLAGGVAHDFNNILTAIQGYTELALMELDEQDPLYEYFNEIQKSSMRAAGLTQQLLQFSRHQPMMLSSLDLNKIIMDLIEMMNRIISEDISLITDMEHNLRKIQGNSGNIQQIIMNLVVNARDAMPDGGEITIKTQNVNIDQEYGKTYSYAYPGRFICLSIQDTGKGMNSSVVKHMFEPFYTTKEIGKGTGLGLSVAYGIVKQHNGWINVESSPGKGTIFKIYLPEFCSTADKKDESYDTPEAVKGKGERILLVEDEDAVRHLSQRALSNNGYIIFPAANADQAHEIFKKENGRFDLILCDVVLPDKGGVRLVDDLLQIKPGIKVMFVSGYSDEKSGWRIIQEKGYRYLQKPYSLSVLLGAVAEELAYA